MPRQQRRRLRQGEYLPADALNQLLPIPSRQIRAADRVLEDEIAREANFRLRAVENAQAGSMTGRMADFKLQTAELQAHAVGQVEAGRRGWSQGIAEMGCTTLGIPQEPVRWVQGDDGSGIQPARQVTRTADMVEVGVSDPELANVPAALLGFG